MNNSRLQTIDALRGIAALMVCAFHFLHGNRDFLPEGLLKTGSSYGKLGVEVFFVISGFIIPYALFRRGYRISDFGVFLLKRIVRLEPPYLASILIVLVLGYASGIAPGFRGPPFELSIPQVLLHLAYLNTFFDHPWLNPVFWTLAIELQFYFLIGLLFPALSHRRPSVRLGSIAILAALAIMGSSEKFLLHWLFAFLLGLAAFQFRAHYISWRGFLGLLLSLGAGAWFVNSPAVAFTAVASALIIGFWEMKAGRLLLFFGQISYSLYLLHVPVGGRVINLGLRFADSFPERICLVLLALSVSIAAAWLLYRYVEQPAQTMSSRIAYAPGRERT